MRVDRAAELLVALVINGYSAAQVRAAEAPYLAAGEPLMQRAAAGLAREIRMLLPKSDARVLLLVGPGNNGADALFAGADLDADVAIIRSSDRVHEEALATALAAGAHVEDPGRAAELASTAHVIVDGILGTGTSVDAALRGTARSLVEAILPVLSGRSLVVAVDIPSGIDPDDGSVTGPVLPADITVTFGGYKAGLLVGPAAQVAGEVRLIDIGLFADLEKLEPLVRIPG